MATEKTYNGDGSDTTFDITFPYLTHADIGVSVGGQTKTVGSDYSITGNTVTFTTAPATGIANVKLYRNTNIDTPEHEYSAGSSITAARLNENQKQALYAIEEAKLVTTTSGGITTGNKNDITVNSDTDWEIRTNAIEQSMMADNSVGANELANNAVDTAAIADDAVTADKLANSINTEIAANTAKVTNATHTGEVTGATALTVASNVIDEDNLKVDNSPTNDHVLTAKSSASGGLTWAAIPAVSTLFTSYAILQYSVSSGTSGGSSGTSWTTRDLNTELADPDSIVSISNDEFTLAAGNYLIKVAACSYDNTDVRLRIYDVTNSAERILGMNGAGATFGSANTINYLVGRLTPTGTTAYKLEQISDQARNNTGHGIAISIGGNEVFTTVEIYKES